MDKIKNPYHEIMVAFAEQKNVTQRLWNVEAETANLLTMLAMISKPKIILELGTSNGFSTFHLALAYPYIYKDVPQHRLITIDIETTRQKLAIKNLKQFSHIEFIYMRIEDYLPAIDYQIDFLFIDANKSNYLKYLQWIEPHLSAGAIIVADNIDSHSTNDSYKDYVRDSAMYTTIHISIDDGLLISIWQPQI
jgi:predicted O-methyltransferase YrrM